MADSSSLVDWALENRRKLSLVVQKVTWIDDWLPGYFDYHVEATIGEKIHKGRGTHSSEQMAFIKAVAETLERAACSELEKPWGTAAHPNRKDAENRAYAELLGIDRALCHHYCKEKGTLVPIEELKQSMPIKNLTKMLQCHDLDLALCELRPARDARVFAAYGWNKTADIEFPGIISGFGTSDIWEEAATQAVLECLRKFLAIFIGKVKQTEPLEILKQNRSPWWHIWIMATSAESKSYLLENIIPKNGILISQHPENISAGDVAFSSIDSLTHIFPDMPLVFVQAHSPKLIPPQFGETILDAATRKRLEEFSNGMGYVDMSVPHFYG